MIRKIASVLAIGLMSVTLALTQLMISTALADYRSSLVSALDAYETTAADAGAAMANLSYMSTYIQNNSWRVMFMSPGDQSIFYGAYSSFTASRDDAWDAWDASSADRSTAQDALADGDACAANQDEEGAELAWEAGLDLALQSDEEQNTAMVTAVEAYSDFAAVAATLGWPAP